jgi:hypothetical protein
MLVRLHTAQLDFNKEDWQHVGCSKNVSAIYLSISTDQKKGYVATYCQGSRMMVLQLSVQGRTPDIDVAQDTNLAVASNGASELYLGI